MKKERSEIFDIEAGPYFILSGLYKHKMKQIERLGEAHISLTGHEAKNNNHYIYNIKQTLNEIFGEN